MTSSVFIEQYGRLGNVFSTHHFNHVVWLSVHSVSTSQVHLIWTADENIAFPAQTLSVILMVTMICIILNFKHVYGGIQSQNASKIHFLFSAF